MKKFHLPTRKSNESGLMEELWEWMTGNNIWNKYFW